jgi:hypothetical protein
MGYGVVNWFVPSGAWTGAFWLVPPEAFNYGKRRHGMYGSRHVWFHSGAILAGRENTKMSNEGDQDGWEWMGNGGHGR